MECRKINGRKLCVVKEIKKNPVGTIGPAKGCFEKWCIGGRNVAKRGKRNSRILENYMTLHARRLFQPAFTSMSAHWETPLGIYSVCVSNKEIY
jgi:hypothetical protein